jgi:hypothetical protein
MRTRDLSSKFWVHLLLGIAFLIFGLAIPEIGVPLPSWAIWIAIIVAFILIVMAFFFAYMTPAVSPEARARGGGAGGYVHVVGSRNIGQGGEGGRGGAGEGGRGGDAVVEGTDSIAIGGKGGDAMPPPRRR